MKRHLHLQSVLILSAVASLHAEAPRHDLPSVGLSVAIPAEMKLEDKTNFSGKSGLTLAAGAGARFEGATALGLKLSIPMFDKIFRSLTDFYKSAGIKPYDLAGWKCYRKTMQRGDGKHATLTQCFKEVSGAGIAISLFAASDKPDFPDKESFNKYLKPILESIKMSK